MALSVQMSSRECNNFKTFVSKTLTAVQSRLSTEESLIYPDAPLPWGLIVIEAPTKDQKDYASMISLIKGYSHELGMTLAEPVVRRCNLQMQSLKNEIVQCLEQRVKFSVIIVPTIGQDYYNKVKQLTGEVGVLTRCVKQRTAQKPIINTTMRRVARKVNSKLSRNINQGIDSSTLTTSFGELSIRTPEQTVMKQEGASAESQL